MNKPAESISERFSLERSDEQSDGEYSRHASTSDDVGCMSCGRTEFLSPSSRGSAVADSDRPIFVLTSARCGSTLLRHMLDAHPDLYCPPETNISQVFQMVYLASASVSASTKPDAWKPAAAETCRALGWTLIGRLAAVRKKRRWCDKSLPTIDGIDVVTEVYPDAQFISLHREHCDFIASALEACPWGLNGFGFDPYARDHPGNSVQALARYWSDRTERLLALESTLGAQCHQLRYEDLVLDSDAALKDICAFLDVSYDSEYFERSRIFDKSISTGPEDVKFGFTSSVHSRSVGRGAALPLWKLLPKDLLDRMEGIEERIGRTSGVQGLADAAQQDVDYLEQEWLAATAASVRERLETFGADRLGVITPTDFDLTATLLIVKGNKESRPIHIQHGVITKEGAATAPVISIQREVAALLLSGEITPTTALRTNLLSATLDGEPVDRPEDYILRRLLLRAITDELLQLGETKQARIQSTKGRL